MKKLKSYIKRTLFGEPSVVKNPLKPLTYKVITSHLKAGKILGIEREEQFKLSMVAVKTCDPNISLGSFSNWMIAIQHEHRISIQVISEWESMEVLTGLRYYASGMKITEPTKVKNT